MKKRVFAFILVLTFVLPMCSAPSYAKYDKEILFRDIPWGSTYKETMESLEKGGAETDNALAYARWVENITADVGGHKMNAEINFVSLDPIKKSDDNAFYEATYWTILEKLFSPDDRKSEAEELMEEFCIKLTSLYGEPDDSWSDKDNDGHPIKWYSWTGANGTKVSCGYHYGSRPASPQFKVGYEVSIIYTSEKTYDDYKERTAEEEERRKKEEEEQKKREQEEYVKSVTANVGGL